MTSGRGMLGAAIFRENLYAGGGAKGDPLAQNSVEKYSFTTGQWSRLASRMNERRYGLGMAVVDDKMFAIGGRNENDDFLKTVEVFNMELETWTYAASMSSTRYGASAVVVS